MSLLLLTQAVNLPRLCWRFCGSATMSSVCDNGVKRVSEPTEVGGCKRQRCEVGSDQSAAVADTDGAGHVHTPVDAAAVGTSEGTNDDRTSPTGAHPDEVKASKDAVVNIAKMDDNDLASEAEHWRKMKKILLLVSYSGKGYLGMQRNPGCKTIEEDLLRALHGARAIPEQGLREQQSVWFQRAARTDKGVSAAKQSVSLRMVANDDVLEAVNAHLPAQIRVFDLKRVTKKFDAKLQCCARTYLYMCPTFAFCPLEAIVTEEFRITDDVLSEVNRLFGKYVGTHNYHNFTSRRKPSDPSTNRFIMSMDCSRPFVRRGLEMVAITVKGQSFMLHQIRKMVGLVMAVARGHAAESVFERAWSQDRIDLPVAPALGLMLHEVHYDRYNKRFGSEGSKTHEDIEWSAVENKIEAFKEEFIYSDMVETELANKSMLTWLGTLPLHTFDIRAGDQSALLAARRLLEAEDAAAAAPAAAAAAVSSEDAAGAHTTTADSTNGTTEAAHTTEGKKETVASAQDKVETAATPEGKIETSSTAEGKIETSSTAEGKIETSAATEGKIETSAAAEGKIETVANAEGKVEIAAAIDTAEDKSAGACFDANKDAEVNNVR